MENKGTEQLDSNKIDIERWLKDQKDRETS